MASFFWVGGTGTWDNSTTTHWSSSSGGGGSAGVPGSADTVTFDANSGGGTVTPNYDFTVISITMGAFTGILDFSANNNSPTMATFSCTGSGVRTLNMGSGTWTLTGNAATIWNMTSTTNLTMNKGSSIINANYSGATGTRSFIINAAVGRVNTLNVTAGTDSFRLDDASVGLGAYVTDLNFTGYAGTLAATGGPIRISGNLTLSSGMTLNASISSWTFDSTSGTKTITSNGRPFLSTIIFNGVAGSWQMADNLTQTASLIPGLTLTNGTFSTNGHSIQTGAFNLGVGTKTLILSGTDTYTLTASGTIWDASTNVSGFTLNANSSTVKITNTNAIATISFAGGGMTYNNLWFSRGGSGGDINITGSNTFNDFRDDGSASHSIIFAASTSQAFFSFTVSGHASQLITLNSTTTGTYVLTKTSGIVTSSDYLNIQHCIATGRGLWYAGSNSANNQGTATAGSGWIFTAPPSDVANSIAGISSITNVQSITT
jgi:hypothetical protein